MSPAAPPTRFLLVCLNNLGDLAQAAALVPPLTDRFAGAVCGVWCKAYASDVAALIPGVGRVHAADPFWEGSPGRPRGSRRAFLRIVREVRRERWDVALVVSSSGKAAAAVALAGVPERIGFRRRSNRFWLTRALAPGSRERPHLAELARLLEPLGIRGVTLRARLEGRLVAARGRELLAAAGAAPEAPGPTVLHPFAGGADRCVALAEWRKLADLLTLEGAPVLWVGAAGELAALRTEHLPAAAAPAATELFLDRLGDGSVRDLAAVLAVARRFVGHDSGPLHVAAALGVPVVGVFTPGEPRRTFPQGTGPHVLLERPGPAGVTAADLHARLAELANLAEPGGAS